MSSTISPSVSEAGKKLKVTQKWEQKTHTVANETYFERYFFGEKVFGLGHGNLNFNLKLKTDPKYTHPYVIIESASQEILNVSKIKIEYSAGGRSGSFNYNPKLPKVKSPFNLHFYSFGLSTDVGIQAQFKQIFSSTNGNEIKVAFKVTFEIELKKAEMPMPKSKLLHKLYSDGEFSDVKIHCGGKVFCCHKIILSGQSEVFKKALFGNSIEATSGKIEITDISASAMENLLFYVYHENIDGAKITGDLLVAANKYDISDLVNICVTFLGDNLSEENVMDVMTAAFLTDQEELFELACKFVFKIRTDNQIVVETEAWKELQEEKPILALKMLNKALLKN